MAVLSEEQLIACFTGFSPQPRIPPVWLGPGDDGGWVTVARGERLVLSIDTLVEGVHFLPTIPPAALGHRVLAVSLSDLAAMGASPLSVLLALTLPEAPDESWAIEFAKGFFALARQHQVVLLGGNVTRGPLSLTTSIQGSVPGHKALRRDQVCPGDFLYVTGTLGGSGYAVNCSKTNQSVSESVCNRWWRPEPRVLEGLRLRGISQAAMDLSDGLGRDLPRLLHASDVGAEIWADAIPIDPAVKATCTPEVALDYALYGGEDYELLFSVLPARRRQLEALFQEIATPITCIGRVIAEKTCVLVQGSDRVAWCAQGFQHF